jgi:hypothetical protein
MKDVTLLFSQFTLKVWRAYRHATLVSRHIRVHVLEKRPEDYLTLSKLLWHRNIETTIRIHGARFNESVALCKMEKILGLL